MLHITVPVQYVVGGKPAEKKKVIRDRSLRFGVTGGCNVKGGGRGGGAVVSEGGPSVSEISLVQQWNDGSPDANSKEREWGRRCLCGGWVGIWGGAMESVCERHKHTHFTYVCYI